MKKYKKYQFIIGNKYGFIKGKRKSIKMEMSFFYYIVIYVRS